MALTEKELKRIAELQDRINNGVKIQQKTQDELNKLLEKQVKEQQKLNKEFDLGAKAQRLQSSFAKQQKKLEDDVNASLLVRLKNIAKGNLLEGFRPDVKQKELDLTKKANNLSKDILKTEGLSNDKRVALQGITKDILDGNVSSTKEVKDRINALGLQKNVSKGILTDAQNLFTEQEKTSETINKQNIRMGRFAKAAGFAGIAIGFMVKAITQFAAKIDEVGKTFGFLTNQNQQFRADLISAGNEAIMIGKGLGDVLAVTAQLSSEFGISLDTAADLSTKVLDTAVATGLSNDEAIKLFGTFMQIGDLTAKQAEDLIEGTAQLAAQRGIAPTAVLQDLAGSAEEIAKFTKGSGENIAEAAVQARQLGLSLQTTAKISEGLLDFQNSISAEVEASVMIGRRLNFQSARRLALEGDLAGATKEVVKQLGSEEELNKLNVLQRQSIAKSIGVSVAELNKLVRGQDKLTLSTALTGKRFDDLVGQDSLSTLTSIVNTIKSLGATLLDTFGGPVNAFLKNFADNFAGEGGIERLRARVRSIGTVLISLMNGIGQFLDLFVFGNAFKPIVAEEIFGTPTNDFRGGRGAITTLAGPAGVFRLNPMDSVMATTNPIPVNDFQSGPAGSMGGKQEIVVTGELTGTRGALMATIETPLG
tara:strand:+ start:412 stop:2361 length:1950 start_codon:yes stop_codon:yes gene_type:complete